LPDATRCERYPVGAVPVRQRRACHSSAGVCVAGTTW
jgi:hypothetical protein